jgi:hypothetical protein
MTGPSEARGDTPEARSARNSEARDGRKGMTGGHEILVRLLDATPLPTPGSGIEELLAAFEHVLTERETVLAEIVPPLHVSDDDLPVLVELEERQAAWQHALGDAQRATGEQRCGAAHLRAYAQTP